MRIVVKTPIDVRVGAPLLSAPSYQHIAAGSEIEVDGSLYNGDTIDNIHKWYKDLAGNYYWSGGVEAKIRLLSITRNWWVDSLNITSIWEKYEEKGNKAKIAILDSGYNIKNSDIASGVVESKVFFESVAGKAITIDDTLGHGTHCASIIGGRNSNNITGCAPESELYIAKICSQGSVRNYSIIVDAIKWAIDKRVDIISISYGGENPNDDLKNIIDLAVNSHNILVVASIGDVIQFSSNKPCYPALYPNCIAVGATNQSKKISNVTILDKKIEINAPGESIYGYMLNNIAEPQSGTSQAAAIVSGICALAISHFKNSGKKYTVQTIRDLITQNADVIIDNPTQKLISPVKIFQNL